MTLDFYDLKEEPFGFLPDSRFLYLSSTHRQALSSLLVALQAGRGFVTLVAQRDMGKTTLLFHTLNSLGDRVATVYLFQAPRTPVDLLRAVLTDLGIRQIDETVEGMSCQLRGVLLKRIVWANVSSWLSTKHRISILPFSISCAHCQTWRRLASN